MTVEVALAVMAGAGVEYLTVCDGDDESTGSITRVRLTVLRATAAYSDRIRLRDVLAGSPPSPGGFPGGAGRLDGGHRAPIGHG
nr:MULTISPECIES: CBS domain-containing protein [unclassified Streptomyces]